MDQDLARNGAELPALITAGRWKSFALRVRYTERHAADRGAAARYYQASPESPRAMGTLLQSKPPISLHPDF